MTLFTLTPVSTPPEKDDEYRVVLPSGMTIMFQYGVENRCWINGHGDRIRLPEAAMYYRPLSEEKLREVMGSVWQDGYGWWDKGESINNAIKALKDGK